MPEELGAVHREALFSVLGEVPLRVRDLQVNTARIRAPASEPVMRRAFHTVGVLYAPKSMMQDPSHREGGPEDLRDSLKFNRVCYGYTLDEEREVWRLRFRVHFASEALVNASHTHLAEQMTGLLLRLYWLGKDALNVETRFAKTGVIDVWLMTEGEDAPGGEHRAQYSEHLFFYGIGVDRPGTEWIRLVAHEYGHHAMPPVDGYSGVIEPGATGIIGERLFLPWLAKTGYGLSDDDETFSATPDEYVGYHRHQVRPDTAFFLDRGPSQSLGADRTEGGWRYTHGFISYVVGQYGCDTLAATFALATQLTPGGSMIGIDLLKAFQELRGQEPKPFEFRPGLPIPSLSVPRPEGSLHSLGVATTHLRQDGTLAWWLYLPSADWEVTFVPEAPVEATLGVGLGRQGSYDRSLILSANDKEDRWTKLGTLATGWHVLKVQGTNVPKDLALKIVRLRPVEP